MPNTFIHRTPSSASNRRTWTWSAWIKRASFGSSSNGHTLWETEGTNGGDNFIFQIKSSNDTVHLHTYGNDVFTTTRKLRDTSAWYHIVLAMDTTQGTAANRIKLYINGELQAITQAALFPSQNFEFGINKNHKHCIGSHGTNADYYFDGLMSHIHFSDGYALAPTVFGETDATTGEWKIKVDPSFTLGTNGFTVLKDGNTITDQSANSNNFSVTGAGLTNTKDCPSNVLAVMNPLAKFRSGATVTQGNNTVTTTTAKAGVPSTLGIPSDKGKFYVELKMATLPTDSRFHFGLLPFECPVADDPVNATNLGIMLSGYNASIYAGGGNINAFYGGVGRFNSFTGILGMAVDLTSSTKTIAFSKDGAWITGSNATSTDFSNALKVNITSYLSISPHWNVGVGNGNSSGTQGVYQMNFGNGYYGTTAITTNSGNGYEGAEGASKFSYPVPSGYSALSTKGLNQ